MRWQQVQQVMEASGHLMSWEDCRKKWYRLENKYKEVKEAKQRSGAGASSWTFFDIMDSLMSKDPAIQPHHLVSSNPLNTSAQAQTPQPASPEAGEQSSASPAAAGRKRRRPVKGDTNPAALGEFTNLMKAEAENRTEYRQKKLALMERLVSALEKKDGAQ